MTMGRGVVAGGGLAGLLAAAACAPHVDEVVVVEAHHDADGPTRRAPQAGQLHNILTRGQRHLEELFPGFRRRVLDAGAVEGSVADDTHVFELGGAAVERPLGLTVWGAPWEVLSETARGLLPGNVRFAPATVEEVLVEEGSVRGAVLRSARGTEAIDADLVVDATGYGTDALLRTSGLPLPETTEVRLDRWFVTARLRRPEAWRGSTDFWMVFTEAPERHVALLSPFRTDEWVLSISSEADRRPPQDLAAIGDLLDELPGPPLRPLLEAATPLGAPTGFRRRAARWRHHEAVPDPVEGFVPIGDAYATINPVYGQGVGVAAWQASLLGDALAGAGSAPSWTRRYLAAAGEVVAQAWALADVPMPALGLQEWIGLAGSLARDPEQHRRYVGIWHLVEPPSVLDELLAGARRGAPSPTSGGPR